MNAEERAALLAEIAESRRALATAGDELRAAAGGIRDKLDLPARIAGSFRRHRPAWIGGAALLGFLLTRLPARTKTVYVDKATGRRLKLASRLGLLWTIAKYAGSAASPWLKDFAGTTLAALARRFAARKMAAAKHPGDENEE